MMVMAARKVPFPIRYSRHVRDYQSLWNSDECRVAIFCASGCNAASRSPRKAASPITRNTPATSQRPPPPGVPAWRRQGVIVRRLTSQQQPFEVLPSRQRNRAAKNRKAALCPPLGHPAPECTAIRNREARRRISRQVRRKTPIYTIRWAAATLAALAAAAPRLKHQPAQCALRSEVAPYIPLIGLDSHPFHASCAISATLPVARQARRAAPD